MTYLLILSLYFLQFELYVSMIEKQLYLSWPAVSVCVDVVVRYD